MTRQDSSDATTRIGALNGKWMLGTVLVIGDIATVYEATHLTNGKRVAVKILHTALASSPEALARFHGEALLANKVGHPGAVQVLDDDVTEDGAPFLVMERLEGESIADVISRTTGAVTAAEVLRIGYEILDVLAAAHANGILHRNVRPESVFLTKTGKVKLLDFELPSARGSSPESDAHGDIRAVGAIMFRLLSGRAAETGERVANVGSVVTGLSPEVVSIVDMALAFEKGARWSDARAMQRAIEHVAPRVVERPGARTLDFSPSGTPSLRFRIVTIEPPRVGKRTRLALLLAGLALCSSIGYEVVRSRLGASITADPHHAATPIASAPHEVDLPAAAVDLEPPTPEPVRVSKGRHRRHGQANGNAGAAPEDPAAASELPSPSGTATPSMLDRRH